jgi:hypothetical protein
MEPKRMKGDTNQTGTIRIALQLGLGFVLLLWGIGLLTDVVSYRPPAIVYFAAGGGLLLYGISRMWKS